MPAARTRLRGIRGSSKPARRERHDARDEYEEARATYRVLRRHERARQMAAYEVVGRRAEARCSKEEKAKAPRKKRYV